MRKDTGVGAPPLPRQKGGGEKKDKNHWLMIILVAVVVVLLVHIVVRKAANQNLTFFKACNGLPPPFLCLVIILV